MYRHVVIFFLSLFCAVSAFGLNLEPPAAKKYLKSQRERMSEIRNYKQEGYIGEADTGFLAIRSVQGLKKPVVDKITKAVKAENNDRKHIFQAIIKFNKLDSGGQKDLIQSVYTVYKNTSAHGTYYFEKGKWDKRR